MKGKGVPVINQIEHTKLLINRIIKDYQTEGPLPSIKDLNVCLDHMDPQELAQAIYCLEYKDYLKNSLETPVFNTGKFENLMNNSLDVKNDIEKIFMAVAEHFRRVPSEAAPMVDQMFQYFYKTLVHLSSNRRLTSLN